MITGEAIGTSVAVSVSSVDEAASVAVSSSEVIAILSLLPGDTSLELKSLYI